MKCIPTQEAVGHVLCHDLTRIVPGVTKDAAFRKGHIVTEEDIPLLLSMGKDRLYVWEKTEGMLHENEGADRLLALCRNAHMTPTPVKEGKIELKANCTGLFRVDVDRLMAVNAVGELMIATRHTNTVVRPGDKLAGMRVIPLVIAETKLQEAEQAAGSAPLLELLPFVRKTAAVVTTGNEVFYGRIQDQFTPVLIKKLADLGVDVVFHTKVPDDREQIVAAIQAARESGAELVLCTGGMSVDPDDQTPGAIKASGAEVVAYGAPVLPGAMFLLGYFADKTPVMGLPGCVMYAKATIFDLILPRVLANVPVSKADLARLGHGGLCLGCAECHYPVCPFGKEA
ncbi:molybdopterin-binding protein [Pseudoflavonifractor phocaeensis]|uniref:molybdopterin-binding protein n=1 Tax=Pseudoflavonifractor phocaeensis TaxID=1870988 RepID=UPI00195E3FE7|nr:molybdopterin-binding protein [Pseudoflavonifractor phocaeensis]MBM6939459.1 molybdopterin-binding protein [Pseudoflavonifractor phocaeensis]